MLIGEEHQRGLNGQKNIRRSIQELNIMIIRKIEYESPLSLSHLNLLVNF